MSPDPGVLVVEGVPHPDNSSYLGLSGEGLVLNCLGAGMVSLAIIIPLSLGCPSFNRKDREGQQL